MSFELVEPNYHAESRNQAVWDRLTAVAKSVAPIFLSLVSILMICVLPLVGAELSSSAEPLSKEDVMLLVLSGALTQKKSAVVRERGTGFHVSADMAQKLRSLGAEESLLDLLASSESSRQLRGISAAGPGGPSLSPSAGANRETTTLGGVLPGADDDTERGLITDHSRLARPSDELIARIIQEFVRKDQVFRKALTNYNYHQLITVKQLNRAGKVVGVYRRGWDNVFDDAGNQISRVTYADPGRLKRISISEEDSRSFEQTLFTSEVRPDYDFDYLDHVRLDRLTTYTFSVKPKRLEAGKRYFEGTIWVDDLDLQIVKVDGRRVPAIRTVENDVIKETLFPHFTEYRKQVDGKYWFPMVDFSDDTLQFAFGAVHVQVLVNYSNYKCFGAESRLVTSDSGAPFPPEHD